MSRIIFNIFMSIMNIGIFITAYVKGDVTLMLLAMVVAGLCAVGAYSSFLHYKIKKKTHARLKDYFSKNKGE